MTHFNIQISIQRVQDPEQIRDSSGHPVKVAGRETFAERKVIEVLKMALTAATEEEAYAKAHKMLTANAPEPVPHLHRASCDDSIGNQICEFPPGPSI